MVYYYINKRVLKKLPEAPPHKRRLKCDTISPRRLMTHLLHQMVHHRSTLRGNGQWSATIARITTKTHTTTLTTKRGSSESCAILNFLRVTLSTGKAGCRTVPLLSVIRNEVWIFLCKNKGWGEYKRTQQVQPHPRRGNKQNNVHGNSRIRLRFSFAEKQYFMQGFIWKKAFSKTSFLVPSNTGGWSTQDPSFKLLPDSSSAVAHGTTAGHISKTTHANPSIPRRNTVVWPNHNSSSTVGTAIRIGFKSAEVCNFTHKRGTTARSP